MGVCPFANQDHRYDSAFPTQRYTGGPNKGVVHTTETGGLPGYAGGSQAPHFSVLPIRSEKRVVVYQHFDTNRPSRALADQAGGVQTNNDGVVQIELIGTCTPSYRDTYGYYFWPEADDWALAGVRELMEWIEKDRGIPRVQPPQGWSSTYAGAAKVRMSGSTWDRYAGWAGHQHVPENSHWDPGDMSALFDTTEEDPFMGLTVKLNDFQKAAIGTKDDEWEVEKILPYIAAQAALSRKESVTANRLLEAQAEKGRVLTPEEVKAIAEGVAAELSDDFEVTGDVKLAKKTAEPTA